MIQSRIKISHLVVMAIGAILVFGLAFSYWVATSQDSRMREELLTLARTAVKAVDLDKVMRLSGSSADLDTPDFQQVKGQLGQMCSANPRCRYIYLMGRREDGMVYFLVDSGSAESEDYSPPGQTYDEASATLHQVFATGKETTEGPTTDRWGTWVSALIPLLDPRTGELLAILGVDVDSRDWRRLVALHSAAPVSITLLLAALLAVLFILYQRAEREKLLLAASQEALHTSESRFRTMFQIASVGMWVVDARDECLLHVNNKFCEITGYTRAELIQQPFRNLTHPDDRQADWEIYERATRGETQQYYNEKRYVRKDGTAVWVRVNAAFLRDAEGIAVRSMGVVEDITEQKRA